MVAKAFRFKSWICPSQSMQLQGGCGEWKAASGCLEHRPLMTMQAHGQALPVQGRENLFEPAMAAGRAANIPSLPACLRWLP